MIILSHRWIIGACKLCALLRRYKANRLIHVYFLIQFSIEKCSLNVHLKSSNSKWATIVRIRWMEAMLRWGGFLIVNTLSFGVAFRHKSSFVPFDGTICIVFDFQNPFVYDRPMPMWKIYQVSDLIFSHVFHLILHSKFSFRRWRFHSLLIVYRLVFL